MKLDFEEKIYLIEEKIERLKSKYSCKGSSIQSCTDLRDLENERIETIKEVYSNLSPWNKVQIARHISRPRFIDYQNSFIDDLTELHGDRFFGDDYALVGGLGYIGNHPILFIGQNRGSDLDSCKKYNYGMAYPEGYRKAIRLMDMAAKFCLPIVTFIDTPGAYPGIESEARGQASAIAHSIEKILSLNVPVISVVIGEGGSGGAIAIAACDYVMMLEHSIYSVVSAEGCSSILWRDSNHVKEAAEQMQITAQDAFKNGLVDTVIKEPIGGAHRDRFSTISRVEENLIKVLNSAKKNPHLYTSEARMKKFHCSRFLE